MKAKPYDCEQHLTPADGARIGKDIAFSTHILVETTLALDEMVCADMRAYAPDCIVADSMAVWGKAVAKKLGLRACGFDECAHGFVGVVADLVTARGELAHDAERRVGVAVGRDAEKDDLAHLLSPPLSISEKMRSIYSRCMALGRMAMPRSDPALKNHPLLKARVELLFELNADAMN